MPPCEPGFKVGDVAWFYVAVQVRCGGDKVMHCGYNHVGRVEEVLPFPNPKFAYRVSFMLRGNKRETVMDGTVLALDVAESLITAAHEDAEARDEQRT